MIFKRISILCIGFILTSNPIQSMQDACKDSERISQAYEASCEALRILSLAQEVERKALERISPDREAQETMELKERLLLLKRAPRRQSTYAERREYGYNGTMIPIFNGPNRAKHVEPIEGSYIMTWAQPATLFGFWYADSTQPSDRVYLKLAGTLSRAEAVIKERRLGAEILASCLVIKPQIPSKLAIAWEDQQSTSSKKTYVSLVDIYKLIVKDAEIDLDADKIEMDLSGNINV